MLLHFYYAVLVIVLNIQLNNFNMEFITKRQNDPQYLRSVIAQKDIIIEEEKRKCDQLTKHNIKIKAQLDNLLTQKNNKEDASAKQIANLNMALQEMDTELQMMKHEKNECEFILNNSQHKLQELERQNNNEIDRLKLQFQNHKELLNIKIVSLEKNLSELKKYYKVEEHIADDKKKIIEDSNRDLKGFSNEKQERLLIIQNQQFKNEIEYQSKNITLQLQKNQKLLEDIKSLKIQLQLHKQIEADLIKRSSLAQTLIKKLYKQIQDMKKAQPDVSVIAESNSPNRTPNSERQKVTSRQSSENNTKQQTETINKLKFEIANMKNYGHYMENMQKIYSKKYETLGTLLADYLQILLMSHEGENATETELVLNINELRNKDMKEWTFQEMETIIHLIITQIRPFISKNSLIHFPEIKNVNISFVEEAPKQMISLPKIAQNYEKTYDKELKKGQNRFKDIPIDISTKILRSNLREWGSKIKYGNLPVKKTKSRSIMEENQKSFL